MKKRPFSQPLRLVSSKGATVLPDRVPTLYPQDDQPTPPSYPLIPLMAIFNWIVWLTLWGILGSVGMIMWSVFFFNILFGY